MKTEELLEIGLSKEQANKIFAMNGRDIEHAKGTRLRQEEELTALRKTLEEREKELEGYRAMKPEDLKKELKAWKEKALQAEREGQKQLDNFRLREEVQKICRESGVKSEKLLDALIDHDSLSVCDGTVCGLKEQVEALRKSYAFLFETTEKLPYFSRGGKNLAEEKDNILRKAMGL